MLKKLFTKFPVIFNENNSRNISINQSLQSLPISFASTKLFIGRRNFLLRFSSSSSKIVPKLLYLHNPWRYLVTKLNLFKFRFLFDRQFDENEFIRGAKQAAVVMTNLIRKQDSASMRKYATPLGVEQISRDMWISRKDFRLQLINFRVNDFQRAIPMNVVLQKLNGRKRCIIDMLFVGLRNVKDFERQEERTQLRRILSKFDAEMRMQEEAQRFPHRIVFAEIFIRFTRDYMENKEEDWSIGFYKIISFDVLNYDPH